MITLTDAVSGVTLYDLVTVSITSCHLINKSSARLLFAYTTFYWIVPLTSAFTAIPL